jgi:hypothetical protein
MRDDIFAVIAYANSDEGIGAMFQRVLAARAWKPMQSPVPRSDDSARRAATRTAGRMLREGSNPRIVRARLRAANARLGYPLSEDVLDDIIVWLGQKELRRRKAMR